MLRLLRIDSRKYISSTTFWVLLSMYLGLIFVILFGAEGFLNSMVLNANTSSPMPIPEFSVYSFPLVWHTLTFFGGLDLVKLFLALIVIIFITNEFSNKTIRQNIMNGMGRSRFLLSKVLFIFILSFLATLLVFLSGIYLGLKNTEVVDFPLFVEKIAFLPAYFLELFTYSTFVLLLAFVIKRPVLTVGTLIIYYFVEWIASANLPESISAYLPFVSMGNIIDRPNSDLLGFFGFTFREYVSVPDVFTCLVYSFVFVGIVYLILRKSDI